MKLGSAFQKVNFIRDLKSDLQNLNRKYFPEINRAGSKEQDKLSVIKDIENDFKEAYKGIQRLPKQSKLAVLIAYYYYKILLR
jgi:phytoene/squalene synthetase